MSIAISINDGRASLPGRLRSGIFVDPKENIISFAKSGSPRLIPSKESLFLVFFADQWMENIGSRRFVIIKGKGLYTSRQQTGRVGDGHRSSDLLLPTPDGTVLREIKKGI